MMTLSEQIAQQEKAVYIARIHADNASWRMGPKYRSDLDREQALLAKLKAQLTTTTAQLEGNQS